MDSIDECRPVVAFVGGMHMRRHFAIGEKHEVFHQLVRVLARLLVDSHRETIIVEFESHLLSFEFDGAFSELLFAEFVGEVV